MLDKTKSMKPVADDSREGIVQCMKQLKGALKGNNLKSAIDFLKQSLAALGSLAERQMNVSGNEGTDRFIIDTILDLSDHCLIFGQSFSDLPDLLANGLILSKGLGDDRSQAILELYQGRHLYLDGQNTEALEVLSSGLDTVNRLGDSDILSRATFFSGLYYLIQGRFKEALEFFEQAIQDFESQDQAVFVDPYLAIFLGYCSTFLGQFHRAIGSLDCNWRLALQSPCQFVSTTIRAVLGTVLLIAGKKQVADFHLKSARQEAEDTHHDYALYLANQGLAFQFFVKGQIEKAHKAFLDNVKEGEQFGFKSRFFFPWVLEMAFEFQRQGLNPVPGYDLRLSVKETLKQPNIHLQGIAMRMKAALEETKNPERTISYLTKSEALLNESGDPLQLATTVLEIARVRINEGNHEIARFLAHKAWLSLAGYGEEFFPNDLRHLLESGVVQVEDRFAQEEFLKQSLEITENFSPTEDLEESLIKIVSTCNRLLGAERGGLFRLQSGSSTPCPVLWAAANLTKSDVGSDDFRSSISMIEMTFQEGKPKVIRPDFPIYRSAGHQARAVLCLPIELEKSEIAILYHDNSYFNDCFDHLDDVLKAQLTKRVAVFLQSALHRHRIKAEQVKLNSVKSLQMEHFQQDSFISENARIQRLLGKIDQVATTDSAVLIMGETGVGKELMARRLYQESHRFLGPFVVVDLTSIPETLLESELFGHEKGAFTGADRQKKGRIELAHQGTLFIDELGEIPKSIQVKLLRVLQDKTYMRVGGTQTHFSDFRLITATNRNLEKEVADGRFREDLYYRISVVPFTIPPLRERDGDVDLLVRHFLQRYTKKYHRHNIPLSPRDEKIIKSYHWPGNVRELKNVIERAVILSTDNKLDINLLPRQNSPTQDPFSDFPSMDEVQRRYIRYMLVKTENRIDGDGGAAQMLGMKRTTLYARMKKLKMR